jgi:hypothetical protein
MSAIADILLDPPLQPVSQAMINNNAAAAPPRIAAVKPKTFAIHSFGANLL